MVTTWLHADIPTLLLAMMVVSLTLSLAIGLIARGSEMRPLRWWSLVMLLHGLCYLFYALRGRIPDAVSIIVANMVLAAALSFTTLAVAELNRQRVARWLLWSPPFAAMLLFGLFLENQRLRFVISGIFFGCQTLPIILMLWRCRESRGPGRGLLLGTLTITALMHFWRAVAYGLSLVPAQSINTQSGTQTTTYLLVMAILLLATLGFLFMVKERADRALVESEEHFRAFFERSMVGMATVTTERAWIEVNHALCQMLGYSRDELLQHTWYDLTHPDDLPRSEALFKQVLTGEIDEYEQEKRYVRKDGTTVEVYLAVRGLRHPDHSIHYFVALIQDISQRQADMQELAQRLAETTALNHQLKNAQAQLLQSDKMASIGQLAAGVAHEINNPIGFIHSNLGTLSKYVEDLLLILQAAEHCVADTPDSPHRARYWKLCADKELNFIKDDILELLSESRDGADRVRRIVQNLKVFSHVSDDEWVWSDLHQGLNSTLNLIWNEVKYKAEVDKEYGCLPQIYCIASQINQVFLNLLVNAAQAIAVHGKIVIATGTLPDQQVWIEIRDTGTGIDPEHLAHIFDPFFTTKPVGQGTGLGLSLAYSIIQKHGGTLSVASTLGVGTAFRIVLPIQRTP